MPLRLTLLACSLGSLLSGCGGEAPPAAAPSAAAPTTAAAPQSPAPATPAPTPGPAPLPKISLGGGSTTSSASTSGPATTTIPAFTRDDVLAAMKPMQILRDKWNAIRQKSVGTQDAGEEWTWIWDFRSQRQQPALVMTSPKGEYFREARLTYDPPSEKFLLATTDAEGKQRHYAGDYSQPVEEVQGEDNKVHRVYKLQLTQTDAADPKDQWQVVLNQQENNRFLFELYRQRGGSFQRFETISNQRQGTSFALSDSDYGERTCVISGGLGTIAVSFQGKTYYVCCTGCQAAFNEEPARWIAEFEAKKAAKQ